jgi:eukaryotic-like serine/threonine-protein kinase
VDKIATGGMGEVYTGYDETLQRKVAIKTIRPEHHLDAAAKVRFLREARVLSLLGHPNICQIFDFVEGERSDFIVMELVEGQSLKKAMKKGLDSRVKMQIAEQVAGVLVVAHERGVIHRDLKPDNVMLTEGHQVKVLDFGLSRQLSSDTTRVLPENVPSETKRITRPRAADSQTSLTTVGAVMGTLGYMSPEQARGELAGAASDMYSFGLLLQELFTGKPPFETGLDVATRLEKARRGDTQPVTGLDPDLTALVNRLKSLEPGARPSAEDTVQRLAWIRAKPLRRRRKLLLSGAAAALVVFSIAMAVQSVRAVRAEKRAREQAETAKQVSEFLVSLFKVSDPGEARGKTVTAREILDAGARKITAELNGQPLVQARLLTTIGTVYIGLGLYKDAEPLLASALSLREKNLPPDHPDLADSLNGLAVLYWNQGRYAEAEPLAKRALAAREKTLGPDSPGVAKSLNVLAAVYLHQGKYAEAEPLYRRALAVNEKALGPEHADLAANLNNLGLLFWQQGKYAEAEPLYKRALAINEKALGPDHPVLANSLISLAAIYNQQGKSMEAVPLLKRALAIQEKVLGPDHPGLAPTLIDLGDGYANQGQFVEAEPLLKRALSIGEKALGPDHPGVATSLYALAILHMNRGRYADAEPLLQRALAISEKSGGPGHPDVARSLNYLAVLYLSQGKYAKAEPICKRALDVGEKALGPDHPDLATSLENLGRLYYAQDKFAEAEPLDARCVAIRTKALGAQSVDTGAALRGLAACEFREGKLGESLTNASRCLESGRESAAKTPEDQGVRFALASDLLLMGQIEEAMGKGAEARSSFKEALSVLQLPGTETQSVDGQGTYAQALLYAGQKDAARPIVKRLRECGYVDPDLAALSRKKGLSP